MSAFIATLQESNNSLFPNLVYTTSTTRTHTTSPLEFSFQQKTLPGSGQVPVHQHYLSSQLNTNFNGNSNNIVNNPVISDNYHNMIQMSGRKKQITLQVQENGKNTITREVLWPLILLQMTMQGVKYTAKEKQHY